jgi:hypothetical protein
LAASYERKESQPLPTYRPTAVDRTKPNMVRTVITVAFGAAEQGKMTVSNFIAFQKTNFQSSLSSLVGAGEI